jgi:hypothetical protein
MRGNATVSSALAQPCGPILLLPDQCARRLCKAERIGVGKIEDAVNGGRG